MKKETIRWVVVGLLASTGAVAGAFGCSSKSACQTYADDMSAKISACGVTATATGTSTGTAQNCTDALAKQATCLDGCVSKFDCCIVKNPTDPNCATAAKAYTDCALACQK